MLASTAHVHLQESSYARKAGTSPQVEGEACKFTVSLGLLGMGGEGVGRHEVPQLEAHLGAYGAAELSWAAGARAPLSCHAAGARAMPSLMTMGTNSRPLCT